MAILTAIQKQRNTYQIACGNMEAGTNIWNATNQFSGVTAGTVTASKAIVVGSSKEIDTLTITTANIGTINTTATITSTITAPTAPDDAVKGNMLITVGYSAGSANALKGVVTCSAVAGQTVRNMSAGWFGLEWTAAFAATGAGVSRALAAEVVSKCASAKGHPNAIVYLQSVPSAAGSGHATMPFIVFTESGSGTGTNILFEVGHAAAAQTCTIGTGNLFYENTLQIYVNETAGNRTSWYIPLSSAEASYTTAFPISTSSTISSSYVAAEAIVMGASGTHITSAAASSQIGIYVDNSTASGSNRVIRAETLSSGASNTLVNFAGRFACGVKTGVTNADGAWCIGVQGKVVSAGTHAAGTRAAAVLAQIGSTGTFSAGGLLYGAWIDCQLASTPGNGDAGGGFWMLGITNGSASCTATSAIRVYGNYNSLFDLEHTGGDWFGTSETCSTEGGFIEITTAAGARYIQLWTTVT